MKLRQFIIILLMTYLSGLFSCGKNPKPPLPAEAKKFVQVYVDLLEVQEKIPATHPAYPDSCRQILALHDLLKSDYERMIAKLNQKSEHWETFYSQVLLEIDRRKTQRPATVK